MIVEENDELDIATSLLGLEDIFYSSDDGRLVYDFGIREILKYKERKIDEKALKSYFAYGFVPCGYTMIKDVYRIPPACSLKFKNGKIEITKYWDLVSNWNVQHNSEEAFAKKIKEILFESVRNTLKDNERVGVFISGGLDSTIVLSILNEFKDNIKGDINTFTVRFEGEIDEEVSSKMSDEVSNAKKLSEFYKTKHFELTVDENDVKKYLPEIVRQMDIPTGDSVPIYKMFEKAKEVGVDTLFSGDGGDELFGGYGRPLMAYYIADKIPNFSRKFFSIPIDLLEIKKIRSLFSTRTNSLLFKNLFILSSENPYEQISLAGDVREEDLNRLMDPTISRYPIRFPSGLNPLQKQYWYFLAEFFPNSTRYPFESTKDDANSIKVERPLMCDDLLKLSLQIPNNLKINKGVEKYILRRSFKGIIPDEVFERKKRNFAFIVPTGYWLKKTEIGEILKALIEESDHNLYNKKCALSYFETIDINPWNLWKILIFEIWYKNFIEGESKFK